MQNNTTPLAGHEERVGAAEPAFAPSLLTGDLHLARGVECHQADVGVGEGAGALVHLLQHLAGVGAAKHGQLPHGPVPVVCRQAGGEKQWAVLAKSSLYQSEVEEEAV